MKLTFDQQNRKKNIEKEHSTFIVAYFSIFMVLLHRIRLIGPAHSSQFMEWYNSDITTLNQAICAPNIFKT